MAEAQYFTKLDTSNAFWQIGWMKKAPNSSPSILPEAVSDFYTFHMGFIVPVSISPKPPNQNSTPMSSREGHYLVLCQASKEGTSRP